MKKTFMLINLVLIFNALIAANLNEQFSGSTFPPQGWIKMRGIDNLGTGNDWFRSTSRFRSTPACAAVDFENVSGGLAEDWLITPQLMPEEGNSTFSFWMRDRYTTDYGSIITVRVSDAAQNFHDDFEIVETYTEPGTTYVNKTIDLSRYIGYPIYIAIVMTNDDGDNLYVDDVTGPPIYVGPIPPSCVQASIPPDEATNVSLSGTLNWTSSDLATGYKIYFGTDNPPTNIADGIDLGSVMSYDPNPNMDYLTEYFWKIVPYNQYGDATGCPIWSFTTMPNPIISSFPYFQNFDEVTSPNLPFGWTIENSNGDTRYWRTNTTSPRSNPNSMYIAYNQNMAMDDWFFSPPLQLTGGQAYKVSFFYKAASAQYPERLELKIGNEPTSSQMSPDPIFNNNQITNTSYAEGTAFVTPDADGLYYLGWHGYSARDMYNLYVDNVSVEIPISLSGTVTNLETGMPIEGAIVSVPPFQPFTTLADGRYFINLSTGIYDITATATGYNETVINDFSINESMTLDFQLTSPKIHITPAEITESIPHLSSSTRTITISNSGNGPLNFTTVNNYSGSVKQTDYSEFNQNYTDFPDKTTEKLPAKEPLQNSSKDEIIINYDGPNTNSIGTNGAANFIVAARFTADELSSYYSDYQITGIQLFISQNFFSNVTAKVWEGGSNGNPGNEVYSKVITSDVVVSNWTTHYLDQPVVLNPELEYWIGYSINATGGYPAGCDAGPAIGGKGQWIYFNNNWSELLDLNSALNYNWNIRGILDVLPPSWFSVSPESGIVLPGESLEITLGFDGSTVDPGTYASNLLFSTDPQIGEQTVPITFNVYFPEIYGNVTSLASGQPLDNVSVEVSGYPPALTQPDGSYTIMVESGVYDITFSKEGYNIAVFNDLSILDNNLLNVQLTNPILEVNPSPVHLNIEKGDLLEIPIEFSNSGNGNEELVLIPLHSWLSLSETSINLIPGQSLEILATIDASLLQTGQISSSIQIQSNPVSEIAEIPVELNVVNQIINLKALNLNQNSWWTAISTNYEPGKADVSEVLSGIVNDMVIMLNNSGIYWPEHNINTIGQWNVYSGYKLKMQNPAQLTFTGTEVFPKIVNLAAGINYLPVLCNEPVNADEILQPVLSKMVYLFDIYNLKANWPSGGIHQIDFLEPGMAYLLVLTSPGSVSYASTAKTTGFNHFTQIENKTNWNNPVHTDNYHLISILPDAFSILESGDFVGTFDRQGNCTGLAEFTSFEHPLPIYINGDDQTTTEKDGMTGEEKIAWKIYRPGTSEEFDVTAFYDPLQPSSDGQFRSDGLSMVTKMALSSLSSNMIKSTDINIFPNPSKGIINLNLNSEETVKVEIRNIQGMIIFESVFEHSGPIDLSSAVKGIYFLKIKGEKITFIEKIILD